MPKKGEFVDAEVLFMRRVRKTAYCWLWTGATSPKGGHGVFHWIDRETGQARTQGAHRWLWIHLNGHPGEGVVLDHVVCDNPPCVNPDHLGPTTQQGNLLRSEKTQAGLNSRKTHCVNNHEFTEENTCVQPRAGGGRMCRICMREASRRANEKKKGK